jgi:hypothetical protein
MTTYAQKSELPEMIMLSINHPKIANPSLPLPLVVTIQSAWVPMGGANILSYFASPWDCEGPTLHVRTIPCDGEKNYERLVRALQINGYQRHGDPIDMPDLYSRPSA